jgi:hypothetical protein
LTFFEELTMSRLLVLVACLAGCTLCSGRLLAQDKSAPVEKEAATGVTPAAQAAIDKGLEYLAREQAANGSWGKRYRGSVAVTSLAARAFLAAGHKPGQGKYGMVLTRALNYVLSQEDAGKPGLISSPGSTPMYNHGFGVQFLAEALGKITEEKEQQQVKQVLERAVKLLDKTQDSRGQSSGGWRYQPIPSGADISLTCCQLVGLNACKRAGIEVPQRLIDRGLDFVKRCQNRSRDGGFWYQPTSGVSGIARSAAAVLTLQRAGAGSSKEVEQALTFIAKRTGGKWSQATYDLRTHYFYGSYYAAQALWNAGDKHQSEAYPALRDALLARLSKGGLLDNDHWVDRMIDDHCGTAMALLALQAPRMAALPNPQTAPAERK